MSGIVYDINELDLQKKYSYADYLMWKFKERVELLKGRILKMSPAPNIPHQSVSIRLATYFMTSFQNNTCQVFSAPFDVALLNKSKSTPDNNIFTIVQPDLCIVCDPEKLADGKKCNGAPDLIVEILSPGNSQREMDIKFDLYQEAGVREYWLAFPEDKLIQRFVLRDGQYIGLKPCVVPNSVESEIFPDLNIDLNNIFTGY